MMEREMNKTNHTVKQAQYIQDETPETRRQMWSRQMIPNLKGQYCLFIPKRNDLSREEVNKIFSVYGAVAEMTSTTRCIFVRYADKNHALNALEGLRNKFDITIPEERDNPRKVVKHKDVSGELPAYPKVVAKRNNVSSSADENNQLEVFMGNLPYKTTEAEIWDLLKGYDVLNIRMKENNESQKKFSFVLVPNVEESEKIAKAFHKTTFNGRILVVQTSYSNVERRPALEDKIILDSMKKKGVEGTTSMVTARLANASHELVNEEDINERPPPLEKFIQRKQMKHSSDRPPGLEPLSKDRKNDRFDDSPPGLEILRSPDHRQQQRRPGYNSFLNEISKGERFTHHPPGLESVNSNKKHQERKQTYNQQSPSGKRETFGSNRNQHRNKRGEMNIDYNPSGFGKVESGVYYARKPHNRRPHNDSDERSYDNQVKPQKSDANHGFHKRINDVQGIHNKNYPSDGPPRLEPVDLPELEKIISHHNSGHTRARNFRRGEGNRTQYERPRQSGHYGDGDRHRPYEQSDRYDLYVANFPYGITENDLMELFEPYGATYVAMKNNQHPGKSYCFVVFENYDDASECITNLDGVNYYGRTLYVCFGRGTFADENELLQKVGNFRCTVVNEGGDNDVRIIKLNKKEAKSDRDTPQGTGGKKGSFKHQSRTEHQQFKSPNRKPKSQQQDGIRSTNAKQDLSLSAMADLQLQERQRHDSWETVSESSLPGTSSTPGSSQHVSNAKIAPAYGQTHKKEDTASKAASKYHEINRKQSGASPVHIPESMRNNNLRGFLNDCFPGLQLIKASDLPETVEAFVRISEGNSYFWGQLVNENMSNTIHDMLMVSQLEATGSLKPFDFASNRATVLFEGEWYRVWVKGYVEDQANVFFVDWGNTETVFTKDLRLLPGDIWNAKPLAIPFKLQGHESLETLENERVTVQVLSDQEGILAFQLLQENLQ